MLKGVKEEEEWYSNKRVINRISRILLTFYIFDVQ